jgi:uncharacterized lipoprotein YddW (UPF0748 family)/N-acetylmuramoyl-L-alanine amidase
MSAQAQFRLTEYKGVAMTRFFRHALPLLLSVPLLMGSASFPSNAALPHGDTPANHEALYNNDMLPLNVAVSVYEPPILIPVLNAVSVDGGDAGSAIAGAPAGEPAGTAVASAISGALPGVPHTTAEFRGLWVATVLNIDWPKIPTVNAAALKAEAIAALDFAQSNRFNAVFLQIRPTSDAFYPSAIFPWSVYLTGQQGLAPSDGFDPLAFWIAEAHLRGIELHAWMNPYRITKKKATDPKVSLEQLAPGHPARLHPEWVISHSDGNLYFNPGLPEVRSLLMAGISELLSQYGLDGIHFDDYFYPDGSSTKESAKAASLLTFKGLLPGTDKIGIVTSRGFTMGKNGIAKYASPFNDSAAFTQYGGGFASLDDWRRNNVNVLVRDVSALIRSTAPQAKFGVSPVGIWRNMSSDALGSDTAGSESYALHAADTRKWVKEGWVDYIAPQVYWETGFRIADYNKITSWWASVVQGTGVRLYIGQAAFRMDANDPVSAWYGVAELERQLKANKLNPYVNGNIFFSYQSFLDRPGIAAALKALREANDGLSTPMGGGAAELMGQGTGLITGNADAGSDGQGTAPANSDNSAGQVISPLIVGRPASDLKSYYSGFYLSGASNPDKPLYLNGIPVTTRSPKGYFGLFVPLSYGKNTLVLSQEGIYAVRSIWRSRYSSGGSTAPVKMKTVEIPASSVFPQNQLYGRPGETYTFSCTAPIGAKVTVKIGTKVYSMKAGTTAKPGSGAYPTTYRFSWKMPAQTGTARVVNLGAPVYRMVYAGKAKTRTAPGKIGIILPGAHIYAQMLDDPTLTYDAMSTSGGTVHYLDKGTAEAVTGMYGSYVRLASGLFARKTAVKIITPAKAVGTVVSGVSYVSGITGDKFLFNLSTPSAVTADFDGRTLLVRIPLTSSLVLPMLPPDALFEKVSSQKSGSGQLYAFTLRTDARLDGYELVKTKTGYEVPLKRHIPSVPGDMPLAGKSILLDPGHGGSNTDPDEGDTGAIGPMGSLWPERNINLSNALVLKAELEKLGATVSMTRTTDKSVTLKERLAISRLLHPDLFISLHADSAEDNVDISKLSGFSVWYREPLAVSFGDAVLRSVVDGLGKKDRLLNKSNFYVVRGTWAPSILIETGFVPNPAEFEYLTSPGEQTRMMSAIAGAVAAWFAQ